MDKVRIGDRVHANCGNIGVVEEINNGVITMKLDNGLIMYRNVKQIIKKYRKNVLTIYSIYNIE